MAILQVNVRPAARDGSHSRSQWREAGSHLVVHFDAPMHRNPYRTPSSSTASTQTQHSRPPVELQALPRAEESVASSPGQQTIFWTLTPDTTVGRALVSASQRLSEAGCDNPRLDAQVLLAHVLGQTRSWLFAHHEAKLTAQQAEAYTELVARRIAREPVAYLVGSREFYGLDFYVDPRVLIPRPETELLVDLALAQLEHRSMTRTVVADVGTGSGAIAVTLAVHAPTAQVYGLDISRDALDVARFNAERLAPGSRLHFLESDLLEALPEPADIIVANLPYVSEDEYAHLAPDIREHEPPAALVAGKRGLDVIQRFLAQVGEKVKPDGIVLMEIGSKQGEWVQQLAREMTPPPTYIGLRRDYSGHPRLVTLEF
ncbi:MAG: peptide chain release factor N(5)-glutamine methyltransferase [Caldilineae bacterium]|nr:MAG: peptide chain release factor N(5)-glutamine methyltransferase [Caldilineae bacterium]